MIDYQQPHGVPLVGPLNIEPFGVIVAFGVLFGAWLAQRWADKKNLNYEHFRELSLWWVVAMGFLGAHAFDVLFYRPDDMRTDPWLLVSLHKGISSFGGFVGGTIGFALYFKVVRGSIQGRVNILLGVVALLVGIGHLYGGGPALGAGATLAGIGLLVYGIKTALNDPERGDAIPFFPYGDAITLGLLHGFTIGRIGCSMVLDHPSKVITPENGLGDWPLVHHFYTFLPGSYSMREIRVLNLGLYELAYLLVTIGVLWFLLRKRRPHGFIIAYTAVTYAPVRFLLDYLRPTDSDPRYWGFTFAQWTAIALLGAGIYVFARIYRTPKEQRGLPLEDVDFPRGILDKKKAAVKGPKMSKPAKSSPSKSKSKKRKKKR